MDINIIAGKCSEDNNRRIFEILKNRDKNKLEHSRGKENESFKGK